MKLRYIVMVLAMVAGVITGIGATAHAGNNSHEYCTLLYNKCMNDWNGGGIVAVGEPGWPNESFDGQNVYRCPGPNGNVDYVTATAYGDKTNCPSSDVSFDTGHRGQLLVQILYQEGAVGCVGTNPNNGDVEITICNDPNTGYGGGPGTLFIFHQGPMVPYGCWHTPPDWFVASNYWTNYYQTEVDLDAPTSGDGGDLYFNATQAASCWVSQTH